MLNTAFDVVWASSHMSTMYPAELEETFPSWKDSFSKCPDGALTRDGRNVWPVSFWIVRNDA